jgi:hypothetical protein
VAVAMMITAAPVWAFLITMPRAKDTRPSTSVMMVRMFWTGCGCPSEFRMLWRRPESTVPATVTTSRKVFHRKVFPRAGVRNPQVSRPPQRDGYRVPAMLGKLTGLRTTRLFTCAGS